MEFCVENIPRQFQRWKVIMIPSQKSYESWEKMAACEFPDGVYQNKHMKHRKSAIDRTLEQPDYVHTMTEGDVTVRYKMERTR